MANKYQAFNFRTLDRLLNSLSTENISANASKLITSIGIPLAAVGVFLMLWSVLAAQVQTSLGVLPGPAKVWEQMMTLVDEHQAEREKEAAFYERQEKRNATKLASNPDAQVKIRPYTGQATFFDQIWTSLLTVATGFIIASLIAIPIGILTGMSQTLYTAFNPIIQLFKPISPLAWLPIVTMVVSAVYVSKDPMFAKSFLTSAITVTLCCLWPTIINTAVGVSSVDKDLINVSRVLRLPWLTRTVKIVLPSSIPMMFTGLRLVAGYRLDGADRGGNAGPEPGAGQVRLGRIPERQLQLAGAHYGRGAGHRLYRLSARSRHAHAAAQVFLGQERGPALSGRSKSYA